MKTAKVVCKSGEVCWFADPDDEDRYLEISREPGADDTENIRSLKNGDGKMKPIVWAKRGIHYLSFQDWVESVEFGEVA